jgi:hypothetical protein
MEKSIGTAALLGAMCLALMPVAPANAANWVYVAENSDGAVFTMLIRCSGRATQSQSGKNPTIRAMLL